MRRVRRRPAVDYNESSGCPRRSSGGTMPPFKREAVMRRGAASLAIGLAALLALASAAGAAGPRRRGNMPPGWTWPPSRAMRQDRQRCLRELTAMGVAWRKAPATRAVAAPIYVPGMELGGVKLTPIFRKGPF